MNIPKSITITIRMRLLGVALQFLPRHRANVAQKQASAMPNYIQNTQASLSTLTSQSFPSFTCQFGSDPALDFRGLIRPPLEDYLSRTRIAPVNKHPTSSLPFPPTVNDGHSTPQCSSTWYLILHSPSGKTRWNCCRSPARW